jgi:hypothetical protein
MIKETKGSFFLDTTAANRWQTAFEFVQTNWDWFSIPLIFIAGAIGGIAFYRRLTGWRDEI